MSRAAGGGVSAAPPPWWAAALLLLWAGPDSARPAGPGGCVCTADLLSCSGLGLQRPPAPPPASTVALDLSHNRLALLEAGAFAGLARLHTLRLAHNRLRAVRPGAFSNSSGPLLRHLDLSSNRLRRVERHYFLELAGLEELLLFDNRIVRVEAAALAGLGRLRKAYLSHNRLTDFPFFSVRRRSHAHLSLLDLSSNRLSRLPPDAVAALPAALQRGLYLHNNSLRCDCATYGLFRSWEQRRLAPVTLFRSEHVCLLHGLQRGAVRFLLHRRVFRRCGAAAAAPPPAQESSLSARAGRSLLLHCVTALSGRAVSFHWVAPSGEDVEPPGNNRTLRVFANGSLEVVAPRERDSGVYWCLALDRRRRRNETWEVNVTVVSQQDAAAAEAFNTGFTTLLGCVVSLVLVLVYLYLTPCRCPPCSKAPPTSGATVGRANDAAGGGAQSSILTPTPPASTEGPGRKVSTNKHVVFLEPIREQNGRLRAGHLGPGVLLGAEQQAAHQQRAGETDSMVSVFSDTAIMFP